MSAAYCGALSLLSLTSARRRYAAVCEHLDGGNFLVLKSVFIATH